MLNKFLLVGTGVAVLCLSALDARAVVIPVHYQASSWVADGVTTAFSIGPQNNSTVINFTPARRAAQTFINPTAFTLDKIWIGYNDLKPGASNYKFDLQIFEVANTNAATLVAASANLFSEPQHHHLPEVVSNNFGANYAIFDVENIDLKANQGYALLFHVFEGDNFNNYPYRWVGSTNVYANGSSYVNGNRVTSPAAWDLYFALQPFVASAPPIEPPVTQPPAVEAPEPASVLLVLGGAGLLVARRRRVS